MFLRLSSFMFSGFRTDDIFTSKTKANKNKNVNTHMDYVLKPFWAQTHSPCPSYVMSFLCFSAFPPFAPGEYSGPKATTKGA